MIRKIFAYIHLCCNRVCSTFEFGPKQRRRKKYSKNQRFNYKINFSCILDIETDWTTAAAFRTSKYFFKWFSFIQFLFFIFVVYRSEIELKQRTVAKYFCIPILTRSCFFTQWKFFGYVLSEVYMTKRFFFHCKMLLLPRTSIISQYCSKLNKLFIRIFRRKHFKGTHTHIPTLCISYAKNNLHVFFFAVLAISLLLNKLFNKKNKIEEKQTKLKRIAIMCHLNFFSHFFYFF